LQFTVKQPGTLAACLQAKYPESSKSAIRKWLEHDRVKVNGNMAHNGRAALRPGDRVEVLRKVFARHLGTGIDILHEDNDVLVIHKKENLLTIATEREKEATVYAYLYSYVKRQKAENKIFVVHRLDKKASGVLVFARSEAVKRMLQAQFHSHTIDRQYVAVVEGRMRDDHGTVQNFLAENRAYKVYVTEDPAAGKMAITKYRVRRRSSKYSLVEIQTLTGRKHQIRVHLAGLGHPIIGDKEYGSTKNPLNRLGLHAHRLGFVHPVSGRKLKFEVDAPVSFRRIFSA